jgi:cell division protein FtsB
MKAKAKLRRFRPSRAFVLWVSAFAVAGALQVWSQLQTTQLGYELSALHHVLDRLVQEKGELEVELATVTSPGALDAAARSRLGMRAPREGQIVGMP